MALIALEGMRFFAHHGFYDEEALIGNTFVVDVYIHTDTSSALVVDEGGEEKLAQTVNYETVYDICRIQMAKREKLLETLVDNIMREIKKQFQVIYQLKVRVKKLNPPLGGRVEAAYLEAEETFLRECGRCGKGMVCYGMNSGNKHPDCWCTEARANIHPRTQEMLTGQFKGCLCARCLREFSG